MVLRPDPHLAPQGLFCSPSPLKSNPFFSTDLLKEKHQAPLGDKPLRPSLIFLIRKQRDVFDPICFRKVGERERECAPLPGEENRPQTSRVLRVRASAGRLTPE